MPRTCSGDMYPAVPITTPASVPWVTVAHGSVGVGVGLRQLGETEVENLDASIFGDEKDFPA